MSLNWDTSECKNIPADWREPNPNYDPSDGESGPTQWSDKGWAILNRAIWQSMVIETGWVLTEDKAATFYARHVILARLWGEEPMTEMDVFHLIGLRTNVGPSADQTWRARYIKKHEEDLHARFFKATGIDPSVNKPIKASR